MGELYLAVAGAIVTVVLLYVLFCGVLGVIK